LYPNDDVKSSRTAGPREPKENVSEILQHVPRQEPLTVRVLHGDDFLVVVEVMEERGEDSPAGIQLVITNEVGVVTLQSIQNQGLVSLGDLEIGETTAVGKVKLRNDCLHRETGKLGVHLDVDRLVRLYSDDELVSGNVLEDAGGDVLELDSDFGLLFVQGWIALVLGLAPKKPHGTSYLYRP
jgi:hypothetical protein